MSVSAATELETRLRAFEGQQLRDLIQDVSDSLPTIRKESVCSWVESNVELPTGAITGKVQLRYIPYAREILERYGDKKTRHLVLAFATQLAKALALDTPIPTPSGWTTVGDLRTGDTIFGGDGKPCRVIYKTDIFQNRECYRVTFGDGSYVVADAGHLWKVRRRYDVVETKPKWKRIGNDWRDEVVETTSIRFNRRFPHRITPAGPLSLPTVALGISPYTLGVWLGDGKSSGAVFWQDEKDATEIMSGIESEGFRIGKIRKEGVRTLRISIESLHSTLRLNGLLSNKHIPSEYLRSSEAQRMRLLNGLMDTDGTCSKDGQNASFSSTSKRLADDVSELLCSLGFKPRIKVGRAKIYGKDCGSSFKVSFHPDGRMVFGLKRKQALVTKRKRVNFEGHEIASIDKINSVPVQCIAVDSADHTFLCGKSMIPTHNTTILTCGMLYRIARDPEDAMWVMANADQARDFNKERFMPFVALCKAVMDLVPRTSKGVVDKHLWGFMAQHYRSMVLNFVGAGSPANLASRPRGLIQMDECDKYYDSLSFDAGTIQLAEERQKTFHFPLSVKASSPTLADRMIWTEYIKTDQRKYWVPCPRCEQELILKFKIESEKHGDCGLRWWHEHEDEAKTDGQWDYKKVRANAFYKCPHCAGMIHSFERNDMLENGIWKPSNLAAETGRHGYHLSSLYSILGQETSFGNIAVKFLLAKGLRSELQNFVNGWLAEPWDESQAYEERKVKLEVFTNQDIPEANTVPIAGIDCQRGHYWMVIRRFAPPTPEKPNGESWLLFADKVETEEELADIITEYKVKGENVLADMAWQPNRIGRLVIENDWRGIVGTDTKEFEHPLTNGTRIKRPYSVVNFRDPLLGTSWANRTFKRAMFVKFSKPAILDLVSSLRWNEPTIWHCTINVNPQYNRHLNSRVKRKEKNKRTGREEWVWYEVHQDNHLADAENFVTVRALQLGLLSPPPETNQQDAG